MDNVKIILASKTVWTQILGIIVGFPLGAKYLMGIDLGQLAEQLSAGAVLVMYLAGIVARIYANHVLVATPTVAQLAQQGINEGLPTKVAVDKAKLVASQP